jgi:hypothetical protein
VSSRPSIPGSRPCMRLNDVRREGGSDECATSRTQYRERGGLSGRGARAPLAPALLRRVLGLPDQAIRAGIPPRPETWGDLCGWYSPDPGPVTNLFTRALFGAGIEVTVRGGHLTA